MRLKTVPEGTFCTQVVRVVAMFLIAMPLLAYEGMVEPRAYTYAEHQLINGQVITPVTVVYQAYGNLDADGRNGILILHGMGGTAHAAGRHSLDGPRGYWDALIGPG